MVEEMQKELKEGDMVEEVVEVLVLHISLGVILGQSKEVLEVVVKVVVLHNRLGVILK